MQYWAGYFGIFKENSKYRWNCTAIPVETAEFCEERIGFGGERDRVEVSGSEVSDLDFKMFS